MKNMVEENVSEEFRLNIQTKEKNYFIDKIISLMI